MLVLTRNIDESIFINDDIKVSVLSIKNNQVRIGVQAPKNIPVHRSEIYRRIQQENQQTNNPDYTNDRDEIDE